MVLAARAGRSLGALHSRPQEAQARRNAASKEIGKALGISHRTVEIYRARLMRKTGAASTGELVNRLLSG